MVQLLTAAILKRIHHRLTTLLMLNLPTGGYRILKQVIEGKIKGEMEVTRRRGRRRKELLDDLKDRGG
jgi:hypothetical protein